VSRARLIPGEDPLVEYRNLGRSGLKVSLVGLGCNNFGGRMDAEQTTAVINACLDAGITFFDTADIYGGGRSEEFMAAPLKAHRHDVVIATKAAAPMAEGPYWRGTSRKYLVDAVDACLRRLDTDYIDLFQIHRPEPETPEEETLRTLDDLVRAGKIRYLGNSNYSGWQVANAAWVAKHEHLTPYIRAQNQTNLPERSIEAELRPACEQFGVGILPFFPLASGFLTGKYRQGEAGPEGSRLTGDTPMSARFKNDKNYEGLTKLEKFA